MCVNMCVYMCVYMCVCTCVYVVCVCALSCSPPPPMQGVWLTVVDVVNSVWLGLTL